jgi:GTP-binding protein Era
MSHAPEESAHRCGYIAIIGRPNVGKSTLLNRLVGEKLSITSAKAQTTRHRIVGVVTRPGVQFLLLDTPGFQTRNRGALNRVLNRTASQAALEADVVVLNTCAVRENAGNKLYGTLGHLASINRKVEGCKEISR